MAVPVAKKATAAKLDKLRFDAYVGMRAQDLHPLLDYLKAVETGANDSFGEGSPLLREIKKLVEGDASETDFRLQFIPHPDSGKGRHSRSFKRVQTGRETKTAILMAKNGAFERGQFESALAATHDATNLSRATISRHWKRRKAHVAYLLSVGLL